MTDRIASALRGALKSGADGVTLWRTPERSWQANVRVDGGWLVEINLDPAVALAGALARAARMSADQGAPETGRAVPTPAAAQQGPQSPATGRKPRTLIHVPAPEQKGGGLFD